MPEVFLGRGASAGVPYFPQPGAEGLAEQCSRCHAVAASEGCWEIEGGGVGRDSGAGGPSHGLWRKGGGQRWKDLILSAKAAAVYSGTKVDEMTVMRLFGMLMTNSFTMVSATFDPLGVALDPFAARMNHACEYNATIRFREGRFIDVVLLRGIEAGEEVTVSYVDEVMPVRERKEELRERYFFTCECARCVREEGKLAEPLSTNAQTAYNEAVRLLESLQPDIKDLISSLRSLHKDGFTPTEYPIPSIRQTLITTYLSANQYNYAFIHALIQHLKLDPILYPVAHHPLRLVHTWLGVRIIDHILSSDVQAKYDLDLRPFSIDLDFLRHAIMLSLYRTVHVAPEGEFSKLVDRMYEEGKREWIMGKERSFRSVEEAEVTYLRQHTEETTLKTRWEPVQRAMDAVLEKEGR
jgi:hypothetical protein